MGTVGLNFGSATSGTGFDVTNTVAAIQSTQKAIESPWSTRLTALSAQDTALSTIGTDLATLTTSLQALTDFSGVTAQKNGSSSDLSQVALTAATSSAVAGSHTIVINQLATTSSNYSDTVTNAADLISGNVQITVGGGTPHTITVDPANNTLAGLAATINSQGIGVTASIISDVSGSRLSLVSALSGTGGQLHITSGLTDTTNANTAIGFTVGQTAQNAGLTVDGATITSASNTVTGAIPGVTFQLLSVSATHAPIQVQITNDTASVSTAVGALVTAYNAVAKDLSTQESKDAAGNTNPLYGSSTLSLLQTQLSTALSAGAAVGSIQNVTNLGISFNRDGTIAVDNDILTGALTNNFSDVVGFLQNSDSFGAAFGKTLNGLGTASPTGAIAVAQQENAAQEAALNLNIKNEDALLAAQKITLTTELNTANQVLQGIASQIANINEIYSAVTGYNKVSG